MKWLRWFGFILVLFLGTIWWQWPESNPKLIMCDVGQGDGLLIQQGFSQLVIDTGPSNQALLECLGQQMPFWDRTVETVLISHSDTDHIGGLASLLSHYTVQSVICSPEDVETLAAIIKDRSSVHPVRQGTQLRWKSISGSVLWPPENELSIEDTNNHSLVVRLELANRHSLWLAGDVDLSIESILLNHNLVQPTEILKVSHHGSKTATSDRFLSILRPSQAWISVGKQNRYGHPAQEVIQRLGNYQITIHRTDTEGTVLQGEW